MASRCLGVLHVVHTPYDDDGSRRERRLGVLREAGEFRDKSREAR
jgi:hypothetical protein